MVAKLSFKTTSDCDYCFGIRDIDHLKRFYKQKNIAAGSLEKVSIEFVIQTSSLIRYIIKEFDILLKVGGRFEILLVNNKSHSSYFLSRDQIKYEFSVSTNGRYSLLEAENQNDLLLLKYKKKTDTLPLEDTIAKWTFGTITNGRKLGLVNRFIESVHALNIPQYEIIICGPYPNDQPVNYKHIRILPDVILNNDIRFPVSAKKNKIIESASFNNICIAHDRFFFPDEWYIRMMEYGNYFDYLCLPTVDKNGNRFGVDWMKFCFPIASRFKENKSLRYEEWDQDIIIQGGIIIGKKHLMQKYLIDDRLHWEEMEDMQFSKQAYLDGSFFYLDVNNKVYSEAVNHAAESPSKIQAVKNFVAKKLNNFTTRQKFMKSVERYYRNNHV